MDRCLSVPRVSPPGCSLVVAGTARLLQRLPTSGACARRPRQVLQTGEVLRVRSKNLEFLAPAHGDMAGREPPEAQGGRLRVERRDGGGGLCPGDVVQICGLRRAGHARSDTASS